MLPPGPSILLRRHECPPRTVPKPVAPAEDRAYRELAESGTEVLVVAGDELQWQLRYRRGQSGSVLWQRTDRSGLWFDVVEFLEYMP
jgi:hypothetical protein